MASQLRNERGIGALALVLGMGVVMLIIASTVAAQARYDLRLSMAETQAVRMEEIVRGVFNETAAAVAADSRWPLARSTGCTLVGPYPATCRDVLERRVYYGTDSRAYEQVPVKVLWRASADTAEQETYGWVVVDDTGAVSVVYYHQVCRPSDDFLTWGPCSPGG